MTMGEGGDEDDEGEIDVVGRHRRRGTNGIVVVVGSLNRDLVTYAPSLPRPGETMLGNDFASHMGGKGGNQAVAASCVAGGGIIVDGIRDRGGGGDGGYR